MKDNAHELWVVEILLVFFQLHDQKNKNPAEAGFNIFKAKS